MSPVVHGGMRVVFGRDVHDYVGWSAYRVVVVLLVAGSAVAAVATVLAYRSRGWLDAGSTTVAAGGILANLVYLLAIVPLLVAIPLFTSEPLAREKANGTMACLLATALRPRDIWLGKSLAVWAPGAAVSVVCAAVPAIVVGAAGGAPHGASFLPLLAGAFLVTPLLFCGLSAFTTQLSMIASPELAIAPSYLVGFALLVGLPLGTLTGVVDPTTWTFALLYLAVAVCTWLVVLGVGLRLDKETVIASR
jgi:ABC-type transport system involved in multi-copper enzyme maturation permease subunit